MARIRMLTSVAGEGFTWSAGQEVDLPGREAAVWADGVRAVLVRDDPVETPETTSPSTAMEQAGQSAAAELAAGLAKPRARAGRAARRTAPPKE